MPTHPHPTHLAMPRPRPPSTAHGWLIEADEACLGWARLEGGWGALSRLAPLLTLALSRASHPLTRALKSGVAGTVHGRSDALPKCGVCVAKGRSELLGGERGRHCRYRCPSPGSGRRGNACTGYYGGCPCRGRAKTCDHFSDGSADAAAADGSAHAADADAVANPADASP